MFQRGNRLLLLGDCVVLCRCLKKDARDDARLVLAENLSLEESTYFDLPWFEKADLKNGLLVVYIYVHLETCSKRLARTHATPSK